MFFLTDVPSMTKIKDFEQLIISRSKHLNWLEVKNDKSTFPSWMEHFRIFHFFAIEHAKASCKKLEKSCVMF